MGFAAAERERIGDGLIVDIGCGAGRNTIPLAASGWRIVATDLSAPMLVAARDRAHAAGVQAHVAIALAPIKLAPGESTDGAVFFVTEAKTLGPGHLVVRTNTDLFNFRIASE